MFTVLELEHRTTSVWDRMLHRKPPQPVLTRVAVKSGAPFFTLRITADPSDVPWDTVFYAAGRCASKILASPDIVLPKTDRVRRFVPQYLPLRTALQTLSEILNLAALPPNRLCIGIHDPNGALCGFAEVLLRYASDVRIVTAKQEDYAVYSQRTLSRYGAGFTVDTQTTLLRGCSVLLCPAADILPRGDAICYACSPAADAFLLHGVTLPAPYNALLPDGIDADLFAAALYELCGVDVLGSLCAQAYEPDGTSVSTKTAAEMLRARL